MTRHICRLTNGKRVQTQALQKLIDAGHGYELATAAANAKETNGKFEVNGIKFSNKPPQNEADTK